MDSSHLEKKAMGMAMQAVTIAQVLNQELHAEIQKASNIPQDLYAVNSTFFSIAFFGLYVFRRRSPHLLLSGVREEFDALLKEQFVFAIQSLGYSRTKFDEETMEKVKAGWEAYFDALMRQFLTFRGDITLLLKDMLVDAFNGSKSTSKVKIYEDRLFGEIEKLRIENSKRKWPRKKLSDKQMREVLSRVLRENSTEFTLPMSFIDAAVKGINQEFEEAELAKL